MFTSFKRSYLYAAIVLLAAECIALAVIAHYRAAPRVAEAPAAALLTGWPWQSPMEDSPHFGVTHWVDRSPADHTVVELFDFDFTANPELRLELYDQDEDDATPYDDQVDYWARGVCQVIAHLDAIGRGKVIAAWNGLFFTSDAKADDGRTVGRHVAPVVLRGQVHYNVGNYRWTFGVQYRRGKPAFKVFHLPNRVTMADEFDFAAAGAQCLVHDGQPLKLHPLPQAGEPPLPRPVPSTPAEAGYIPGVDHIRTSRTSMAWSRDSRHLYLLIVKTPDPESLSFQALERRTHRTGGWTLADLQRFWMSMRVWGAVNVDGGDVTQMAYVRPDGRYELVPPRWASPEQRLILSPDLRGAPAGGTLMYFYVRDVQP